MAEANFRHDARKEVESHSSAITNIRIGEIKNSLWKIAVEVMSSKPDPRTKLLFSSIIMEYYLETNGIYEAEDQNKIDAEIKKMNEIAARIRVTGSLKDQENLLQICLRLQDMINTTLQKKGYFFRLGTKNPRGLDAALDIFKENVWEDAKQV